MKKNMDEFELGYRKYWTTAFHVENLHQYQLREVLSSNSIEAAMTQRKIITITSFSGKV